MKKIDISIVVPVYNEQDSILTLFDEITESISEHSWELIFINDGSTDSTKNQIYHKTFLVFVKYFLLQMLVVA